MIRVLSKLMKLIKLNVVKFSKVDFVKLISRKKVLKQNITIKNVRLTRHFKPPVLYREFSTGEREQGHKD